MKIMTDVCAQLGVPLASKETKGPTTVLTFLGIQIDSQSQTGSLPTGKFEEVSSLLVDWGQKTSCSPT